MSKSGRIKFIIIWLVIIVALAVAALLVGSTAHDETVSEAMRDSVLHEHDGILLFGGFLAHPGLVSGFLVTIILLVFAAIVRIFVIPKFKMVPGHFQSFLEYAVGLFDNMAKTNSPQMNGFLGAYIFAAGAYIFIGTLLELLGIQVTSAAGSSVTLPSPMSDINGAITMGCLSYLVILSGGLIRNGIKGVGSALREFSLPISMSFRLFGALLSGALVTELVYYSVSLSFVLPVVVDVLFTLLHALIQAYVLTMLTALFYGEVSERKPKPPKEAKAKKKRSRKVEDQNESAQLQT